MSLRDSNINAQESGSGVHLYGHGILSVRMSYVSIFICAKNKSKTKKKTPKPNQNKKISAVLI